MSWQLNKCWLFVLYPVFQYEMNISMEFIESSNFTITVLLYFYTARVETDFFSAKMKTVNTSFEWLPVGCNPSLIVFNGGEMQAYKVGQIWFGVTSGGCYETN